MKAKKIEIIKNAPAQIEPSYEITGEKIIKDVEGNSVTIPVILGRFKRSQLQSIIDSAQEKLNAIDAEE